MLGWYEIFKFLKHMNECNISISKNKRDSFCAQQMLQIFLIQHTVKTKALPIP